MDLKECENKILNMDCLDFLKQCPDDYFDLVLTDPPYGISFRSNHRTNKYNPIKNDDNLDWLDNWCKEVKRVCKDAAQFYVFCSWHHVDKFKSILDKYLGVKNILIWVKNNAGMGDLRADYAPKYEFILYCNPSNIPLNGKRDSNVLTYNRTGNVYHPTEKPINLYSYLINKSSNENDLILDCFSGSGTTAIACHNLKRRFICIEKDFEYWQASCERLKNAQAQLRFDLNY